MKINKDLVDVILMTSAITLGLVGLSDFENEIVKILLMGGCCILIITMILLRIKKAKQDKTLSKKLEDVEYWL